MKGDKYYWMAVTPDKEELPLFIAESAGALAIKLGISKSSVVTREYRKRSGKKSGMKIVKVLREDEE